VVRANHAIVTRGQYFGLIIVLVVLSLAAAGLTGHQQAASVFDGTTIIGLAAVFALGRIRTRCHGCAPAPCVHPRPTVCACPTQDVSAWGPEKPRLKPQFAEHRLCVFSVYNVREAERGTDPISASFLLRLQPSCCMLSPADDTL
jgi:hypothetical protein